MERIERTMIEYKLSMDEVQRALIAFIGNSEFNRTACIAKDNAEITYNNDGTISVVSEYNN